MRKIPIKTWLLAGVLLLLPCVAHAAGLGQLRILSALGQPLVAEIDLISVQRDELSTLTARLASPDAYRQANLQYIPALIGARFSIERRPNGQPYIRITSTRVFNEPFVELLVELSWAQGRLVHEYTALIDPPQTGVPPAVAAVTPPVAPQATPIAPVITAPLQTKPAAKAAAIAPPATTGGREYGPVKRGETLAQIAAGVKPQGATLEQTLVSLYRSNPDAFAGNMNRLKTGRILRVPEQEEIANTGHADAVKEVRVQTANWNSYRQKLAETAGETPARESKSAASGKIATTVDDKASAGKETPKEVLKLSKGEPAAGPGKASSGKPMSTQARVRALEEEALAREKSLAEANARIAQLEVTIKGMQRLLEVKGQAPPAVPPTAAPPTPAPVAKGDQVAKTEPPKAESAKTDAAKVEPAKDAGKAPPEAPKAEQKATPAEQPPATAPGEAPKGDAAKSEPPKGEQVATPPPPPKPKPRIVAPPPPPPAPSLIDEILGEPLYLIAAGGLLLALLGGLGYWLARRRATAADDDEKIDRQAPRLGGKSASDHAAAMATTTIMPAPLVTDDVDPLAEADLYLNFGRDAQAEEVLKEALEKNPKHEEAQLKLLQIYAARKDKTSFEKVARNLNQQIGSASDNWLKAAAMGYAFHPDNPLYEAGKSVPVAAIPGAGGAAAGPELDFDLELSPTAGAATPDFELDAGKTMIMQPVEVADITAAQSPIATQDITGDSGAVTAVAETAATAPEFSLDITAVPEEPVPPDVTVDAPGDADAKNDVTDITSEFAAPMASAIDFNFDAEPAPAPAAPASEAGKGVTHDGTVILSPENRDKASGLTLDFDMGSVTSADTASNVGTTTKVVEPDYKLDLDTGAPIAPEFKLDDINLNFDETPATEDAKAEGGGAKDDHWYDVQTKFDLAKAYQEMGDKDGAREILQEVIKEGDASQQNEAKQLLDSLS